MASPFRDLELLMDHNIKLASSSASAASETPLQETLPSSSSPSGEQQQTLTLNCHRHSQETLPHHHRPSALASLSLAFGPLLSSPLLHFNPSLSKPRVSSSNAIASSAVKLPSQKKCISPMPVMPAISAANVVDTAMAGASSPAVGKKKKFSSAFPDYHRLPDRANSFGNPSDGGAMRRASVVWFRSDLRCHDNEALSTASKESLSVLPVYVFDPRDYGKSSSGFDKTGPQRARFLLQCVSDLREKLKELGSDLVVRVGKPEEILPTLAKAIGADALYAHQEVSHEEVQVEKKVCAALQEEGVDVKYFWGNTLFHVDDLPFKLEDMPATYSAFREKVQNVSVRETIETPKQFKGLPIRGGVKPGDVPALEELGVRPVSSQRKEVSSVATPLIGGEKEALQRLGRLAADHARQSSNKANVSGSAESLYGSNFSSKISPWLALGCLSPRCVFEELKNKENSGAFASMGSNANEKGPNWLVFELLWRDFFRFITKKQAASRYSAEDTKATITAAPIPA